LWGDVPPETEEITRQAFSADRIMWPSIIAMTPGHGRKSSLPKRSNIPPETQQKYFGERRSYMGLSD
jgi:hypothetical protein